MKKQPAFNRSVKISILAAALFGLPLMLPISTQAMELSALQDLKPMTKPELAKYHAGWSIGGLEILWGIKKTTWVDGELVVNWQVTFGGDLSKTLASFGIQNNIPNSLGDSGTDAGLNLQASTPEEMTKLLVDHNLISTIIPNTKDGAKINDVTEVTIAIPNFNAVHTPAVNSLPTLREQLKGFSPSGM